MYAVVSYFDNKVERRREYYDAFDACTSAKIDIKNGASISDVYYAGYLWRTYTEEEPLDSDSV